MALSCPVEPHRQPADRETFFHAGCGRGARNVGGRRCRTSTSRPSSAFWASRARSCNFSYTTSSRGAGMCPRAPSLSNPLSRLSRPSAPLQHTPVMHTHPLHHSPPLPFARRRPIARDRLRAGLPSWSPSWAPSNDAKGAGRLFLWRCRHLEHSPAPRCHRALVWSAATNFVVSV